MRSIAIVSAISMATLLPAFAQGPVLMPEVPEKVSPLVRIEAESQDGRKTFALVRKPPGNRPFPAIVIIHGSLDTFPEARLRADALSAPTHVRFLAAGYVTVTGTQRKRVEDPQTPAYLDCLAIIEKVKRLPYVEPASVVALGGSGGGSLALEVAAETKVTAIALGERRRSSSKIVTPSSVVICGCSLYRSRTSRFGTCRPGRLGAHNERYKRPGYSRPL